MKSLLPLFHRGAAHLTGVQNQVTHAQHERPSLQIYFSGSAKMYGQNIHMYGINIRYEYFVRNTVI